MGGSLALITRDLARSPTEARSGTNPILEGAHRTRRPRRWKRRSEGEASKRFHNDPKCGSTHDDQGAKPADLQRIPPVEPAGIEPATSCLQSRRSPN
jgi:hypothetical protein